MWKLETRMDILYDELSSYLGIEWMHIRDDVIEIDEEIIPVTD